MLLMGWVSDNGLHEGYLVPHFEDGQRGTGTTGGSIPPGHVAIGAAVEQPDGSWTPPTRLAGEVIGWVVCCDCYRESSFGPPSTWVGPTFTRVPSPSLQNLNARKLYADDADVAYVGEDVAVSEAVHALWKSEHVFGIDALGEVEAAATALGTAKQRLDTAVMMARSSGSSWAAIGRATSMTRQSAQERWGR